MFQNLSYVGIAVRDAAEASSTWCERFGLVAVKEIISDTEGVRSIFVCVPNAKPDSAQLEFVEPLDPSDMGNPVARHLSTRGEGVLQVAFKVLDPEEAAQTLTASGVRTVVVPPYAANHGPRAIVSPKSANGVLLELI
ncbi:VOC family protein [Rhodococcus erythropolis]